jgi:hypothetical protein
MSYIIDFLDQHTLMSKMRQTILQEIVSLATEKLGALFRQATNPKETGSRELYKFSVPEKVLLQASRE